MNAHQCEQAQNGAASASTPEAPNYAFFGAIPGQEMKLGWVSWVLSYLKSLEDRTHCFVLTQVCLTVVGVCIAHPHRELQPAGAVAASVVGVVIGLVGLVAILTTRGDCRAAHRENCSVKPPNS
jgi:hypothetical protein